MRIWATLFLVSCLLLCSCSDSTRTANHDANTDWVEASYVDVAFSDLTGSEKFDGNLVVVEGIFFIGIEGPGYLVQLFEGKAVDLENRISIWGEEETYTELKEASGKPVRLWGRFKAYPVSGGADWIRSIDLDRLVLLEPNKG